MVNKNNSTEFMPANVHIYNGNTTYIYNDRGINADYYEFVKDVKCKVFYFINENNRTQYIIYDKNCQAIGIILPVILKPEMLNNSISYDEHINRLEIQEQEETRDNFIIQDSETLKELRTFIKENSGIWDLTDVKEFLLYNKDEVIKLLQKL